MAGTHQQPPGSLVGMLYIDLSFSAQRYDLFYEIFGLSLQNPFYYIWSVVQASSIIINIITNIFHQQIKQRRKVSSLEKNKLVEDCFSPGKLFLITAWLFIQKWVACKHCVPWRNYVPQIKLWLLVLDNKTELEVFLKIFHLADRMLNTAFQ